MMAEAGVDPPVPAMTITEAGLATPGASRAPPDLNLPSEMEFWEAVSDCSNVVISAAGRHISANSTLLEQQSPVFQAQLAALLDGKDSELYEKVKLVSLCTGCTLKSLTFFTGPGMIMEGEMAVQTGRYHNDTQCCPQMQPCSWEATPMTMPWSVRACLEMAS